MSQVYSNAKIFHYHRKLEAMQGGRLTAPIHVRLKPTNRCTHRCCYCCYRSPNLFLSERMKEQDSIPQEKMREIVKDLGQMGVKAVTFTGGGEPLCYPHIRETIEGLLAAGIKVAMLSHGGLLKGDVAGILAEHAVWVRISMDAADAQSYAKSRQVPPAEFDRVCENILQFTKRPNRKCVLGLNFIVTRENSQDVLKFLSRAKDLGVDHVKVSAAFVSTTPAQQDLYMQPFFDTAKAQIAQAAALQDAHFRVIDKFHYSNSETEAFEKPYTWCPFAQCLTVIAADQNVYTCQDKAYTTSGWLGSIKEQSFKKLWKSKELRDRLLTLNPSRECLHHCVAHAKNLMLLDYLEADQEHLDFV